MKIKYIGLPLLEISQEDLKKVSQPYEIRNNIVYILPSVQKHILVIGVWYECNTMGNI